MIALFALAFAAPTVDTIEVLDARGRWRSVDASGEAVVVREGAEVPLERGMELAEGELLRTAMARVAVELDSGERLHLAAGTELELGERTVLQSLGELYLQLKAPFEVRYVDVEATVEGTRFWVGGEPAEVRVGVQEGAVRVASGGEDVLVLAGEIATGRPGEAPTAPTEWAAPKQDLGDLWRVGRPRAELVLLGAYALDGDKIAAGRLQARRALAPATTALVGTAFEGGAGSVRVPLELGLELGPEHLTFGYSLVTAYEVARLDCPGEYRAVHVGGSAQIRLRRMLGDRVAMHGIGRVGFVGAPTVTLELGFGLGL